MKIKYVSEDTINEIKSNCSTIYKRVLADGETLEKALKNNDVIRESALEIGEFKLDVNQPKGKETFTDAENIKRVYNNMKELSDSQASDERIWIAYTLSEFIDYMKYRWPAKDVTDMKNRYFFNYSPQRSLFRNGISRLWWIGRMTYDERRSDPYELTNFLCKDQDYIESICGRNIFNNREIGHATIKALFDAENDGVKIDRSMVRNVGKYVNLLAGTYILDALDADLIYKKVRNIISFRE